MKNIILLFIYFVFFAFTSKAEDTLQTQVQTQAVAMEQVQPVNHFLNQWQLSKYQKFDGDNNVTELPFKKGEAFVSFDVDGNYTYSVNSVFSSGFWIKNNNFILLKQKSPSTVERYLIVVDSKVNQLTMRNERNELLHFISPQHPDYIVVDLQSNEIIPSEGLTMNSLWRGFLGLFSLIAIAFIFSSNRKAISWKTVAIGIGLQLLLAIGILKVPFIQSAFSAVGGLFVLILDFTKAGSEFLLGGALDVNTFGFIFLFQVLPTIIFFSALTSVLFYLGVIQKIVKLMAWSLAKILKISGAEGLVIAGNIFLGQTEAPLVIKMYLEKMNKSEILLVMIAGMATVAGGVLAAYVSFLGGDDPELRLLFAKHLLTASVMAAPGAIVVSKILYPQVEETNKEMEVRTENVGSNILDAIANGTTEGLKLAANVGAMLLVFIAFIAMINYALGWFGDITNLNSLIAEYTTYSRFSIESILGYIFAPLMWLIGVAKEDVALMGQLLGIKLAASEFVAYIQLAELKDAANHTHFMYEKSIIIATYMLCGFANFASIGIQIGGIGLLAPGQRKTLSEFGMKAVLGGALASLLSATIVGMFY